MLSAPLKHVQVTSIRFSRSRTCFCARSIRLGRAGAAAKIEIAVQDWHHHHSCCAVTRGSGCATVARTVAKMGMGLTRRSASELEQLDRDMDGSYVVDVRPCSDFGPLVISASVMHSGCCGLLLAMGNMLCYSRGLKQKIWPLGHNLRDVMLGCAKNIPKILGFWTCARYLSRVFFP